MNFALANQSKYFIIGQTGHIGHKTIARAASASMCSWSHLGPIFVTGIRDMHKVRRLFGTLYRWQGEVNPLWKNIYIYSFTFTSVVQQVLTTALSSTISTSPTPIKKEAFALNPSKGFMPWALAKCVASASITLS